jgi:hypothetical protein
MKCSNNAGRAICPHLLLLPDRWQLVRKPGQSGRSARLTVRLFYDARMIGEKQMNNIDLTSAYASINHKSVTQGRVAKLGLEIRKILVPTDLRKESQAALQYAISLARVFGAKLTLLHVYQEPYSVDYLRGPNACGAIIRHRRGVENTLEALAAEVRENQVACNADFRCGSLCGEIAKAAENCDIDPSIWLAGPARLWFRCR